METRADIEAALVAAHKERGRALATGAKFDNAKIVKLHEALAQADDREAAEVDIAREAAAKAQAAEVNRVRTEIADLTVASAKALAQAETALRSAVAAQRLHHTHEAAKRRAIGRLNTLTGSKDSALSEFELNRINSRKWLALLNTLTSSPGQFGDLKFPSLHLPPADKAWT
jgi:hypothetical protein